MPLGELVVRKFPREAAGFDRRLPRLRLGLQAGELGQEFFA